MASNGRIQGLQGSDEEKSKHGDRQNKPSYFLARIAREKPNFAIKEGCVPGNVLDDLHKYYVDRFQRKSGTSKRFGQGPNNNRTKSHSTSTVNYGRRQPNILHTLAGGNAVLPKSRNGEDGHAYWTEQNLKSFLQWLSKKDPVLKAIFHEYKVPEDVKGNDRIYPLGEALNFGNDAFVRAMLALGEVDMDLLRNIAEQTHQGNDYVTIAILNRSQHLRPLVKVLRDCTPPSWKSKKDQSTPFHSLMKGVYDSTTLKKYVGCSDGHNSLYDSDPSDDDGIDRTSYDGSNKKFYAGMPKAFLAEGAARTYDIWKATLTKSPKKESTISRAEGPRQASSETPENTVHNVEWQAVTTLLIMLIENFQLSENLVVGSKKDLVDTRSEIAHFRFLAEVYGKEMLLAQARNSDHAGEAGQTPYQTRISALKEAHKDLIDVLQFDGIQVREKETSEEHDSEYRDLIIGDPVAYAVLHHCITHFEDDVKELRECLYYSGDERHLEFDLAGLRGNPISQHFLECLTHLNFEGILLYVALPKLLDPEPRVREHAKRQHRPITNLEPVFKYLRKKGVKKIMKISVVDYGSQCHSDSAILNCLKGFGVEKWDWKRVDLCTDVIADSTKEAQEVSLYSSCNNAVLKGWASEDGLFNQEKFPKGYEDTERREKYIQAFRNKVSAISYESPDGQINVQLEAFRDDGEVSMADEFESTQIAEQRESDWMTHMYAFSKLLGESQTLLGKDIIRPIRIAIIDDGVKASALGTDYLAQRIQNSQSFFPYSNFGSTKYKHAEYAPTGIHGTMMADLICRVTAKNVCRLYVARVQEQTSRSDGSRQITLESAAEAVEWAIKCDVDIISMSWTIEETGRPNEGKSLRDCLNRALSQNILLFCSSGDHGVHTSSGRGSFYPYNTDKCIKIGAADIDGLPCKWVDDDVNFLLPGKEIPFSWQRSELASSGWSESGSSLATAIAAGLAANLIFAFRVGEASYPKEVPIRPTNASEQPVFDVAYIKSKTGMEQLLQNLARGNNSPKYVSADYWFGKCFLGYVNERSPDAAALDTRQGNSEYAKQQGTGPDLASDLLWTDTTRNALVKLLHKVYPG